MVLGLFDRPSSTPVPPPRKYKKNGTLRQPGDSSPCAERKENIPEIAQTKPANSTSLPTQQKNDTGQKKKKPKPPPPPRGSSLGRKSSMPANLQSASGGKKPRPPVPPKPKNYVPKKFSSPSSNFKDKTQTHIQLTKERSDSALVNAESGRADDHGSQFFVNLDKGNYTKAVDSKSLDSESSSQFFVPLDKQTQNDKSRRTQDVPSERPTPSHTVSTSKGDEAVLNGLKNVKVENVEVRENGVDSPQSRSIFYDNRNLSENENSGKHSPDPLEGLEIEVDAVSEDDDEDFARTGLEQDTENPPLSDLVDVNELAAADLDVVVKEQSFDELKPGDSASDSKEKLKVVVSLVLEEECSVSMIDDSLEGQKLVDIAHETANFAQTEEESEPSEGFVELSNEAKRCVDSGLGDDTVEVVTSIVAERLNQDEENDPEGGVEEPMDVDFVSEKLSEDTQQSGAEDLVSVEELCSSTVEHSVASEVDSQLDSHGTELQNREHGNDEIHTGTSRDLAQSDAQENREIIMAEPVREGTFISVTDHAISDGAVEVTKKTNNEFPSNKEVVTNVKEEFKSRDFVSEIETVTQPDVEGQAKDGMDESEVIHANIAVQIESKAEVSSEVESKGGAVEMNDDETSRECLLDDKFNVSVSQTELFDQTAKLDSITNSAGPEEFESENGPPTSVAKEVLLEALADVAESSVNDFCSSGKGPEGNEIAATHIETLDHREEPESQDSKHESETQPQSPEPVRPDRPNRKARQGKHAYESVIFATNYEEKQQSEGKRNDSLTRRAHSFSKYEAAVHSQARPVRRTSNDDAIYSVPSKVIPVRRFEDDSSEYSVPSIYAIPTRKVSKNEYSVPRPIVVPACAVTDRQKVDEDGKIYAVPGLPTAVPVTEHSEKELSVIPQESDNIYVVPAQQKVATTVTAKIAAVPPPKPPRQSLVFEQEKKEKADLQRVSSPESPKPVARARGAGSDVSSEVKEGRGSPNPVPRKGGKTEASESATQRASPSPKPRRGSKMEASESESKEQRASPSPVPRKGIKTEASESEAKEQRASPSPVPRKGSKTAQTEESSESVSPQASDSPTPVQRSRVSALQSGQQVASSSPVTLPSSEVSVEDVMDDKATSQNKMVPPPRPPPPVGRISFVSSEGTMPPPLSPGLENDLESDSDSDVGEEEAAKVKRVLITHKSFVSKSSKKKNIARNLQIQNPLLYYSVMRLTVATQQTFFYKLAIKIQNDIVSIIHCCVSCLLNFARRRDH